MTLPLLKITKVLDCSNLNGMTVKFFSEVECDDIDEGEY